MSSANRIVLYLLGTLLLAGVGWYAYWFYTHFEERSREVRTDISPEARKNRFLAAEYFIRETGQEVQSHAGRDIFAQQPGQRDTIIIGSQSQLFFERNHDELLAWVKAGGQLIYVPEIADYDEEYEDDEYDDEEIGEEEVTLPLLDEIGVELVSLYDYELPYDSDDSGQADENNQDNDQAMAPEDEEETDDELVTVTFTSDHPGEHHAHFLADRYLIDYNEQANTLIGDDEYYNLMRIPLGNGLVTVLSDNKLFSNDHIGEHDHAYLLHQLVRGDGKVWLFYSADMPSLLTLIWKRLPEFTIAATALLLLALWRMLLRSGPQLRPQFDSRRNLLEHLDATAKYSWRVDKARQLFADNRTAIEQAWRRLHPRLNSLEQAERCTWIGEKSGLAARAVERSLYGDIDTEQDFIRASAVLQRLAVAVNHKGMEER